MSHGNSVRTRGTIVDYCAAHAHMLNGVCRHSPSARAPRAGEFRSFPWLLVANALRSIDGPPAGSHRVEKASLVGSSGQRRTGLPEIQVAKTAKVAGLHVASDGSGIGAVALAMESISMLGRRGEIRIGGGRSGTTGLDPQIRDIQHVYNDPTLRDRAHERPTDLCSNLSPCPCMRSISSHQALDLCPTLRNMPSLLRAPISECVWHSSCVDCRRVQPCRGCQLPTARRDQLHQNQAAIGVCNREGEGLHMGEASSLLSQSAEGAESHQGRQWGFDTHCAMAIPGRNFRWAASPDHTCSSRGFAGAQTAARDMAPQM